MYFRNWKLDEDPHFAFSLTHITRLGKDARQGRRESVFEGGVQSKVATGMDW